MGGAEEASYFGGGGVGLGGGRDPLGSYHVHQ